MKNYSISGPSRFGPPTGLGPSGRRWSRIVAGIGGERPGRVVVNPMGFGGAGDPLSAITDTWNKFLADSVDVTQVALGAVLLLAGLLILISATSAGQTVGRGAAGAARRGLRAVPVVGAALA